MFERSSVQSDVIQARTAAASNNTTNENYWALPGDIKVINWKSAEAHFKKIHLKIQDIQKQNNTKIQESEALQMTLEYYLVYWNFPKIHRSFDTFKKDADHYADRTFKAENEDQLWMMAHFNRLQLIMLFQKACTDYIHEMQLVSNQYGFRKAHIDSALQNISTYANIIADNLPKNENSELTESAQEALTNLLSKAFGHIKTVLKDSKDSPVFKNTQDSIQFTNIRQFHEQLFNKAHDLNSDYTNQIKYANTPLFNINLLQPTTTFGQKAKDTIQKQIELARGSNESKKEDCFFPDRIADLIFEKPSRPSAIFDSQPINSIRKEKPGLANSLESLYKIFQNINTALSTNNIPSAQDLIDLKTHINLISTLAQFDSEADRDFLISQLCEIWQSEFKYLNTVCPFEAFSTKEALLKFTQTFTSRLEAERTQTNGLTSMVKDSIQNQDGFRDWLSFSSIQLSQATANQPKNLKISVARTAFKLHTLMENNQTMRPSFLVDLAKTIITKREDKGFYSLFRKKQKQTYATALNNLHDKVRACGMDIQSLQTASAA